MIFFHPSWPLITIWKYLTMHLSMKAWTFCWGKCMHLTMHHLEIVPGSYLWPKQPRKYWDFSFGQLSFWLLSLKENSSDGKLSHIESYWEFWCKIHWNVLVLIPGFQNWDFTSFVWFWTLFHLIAWSFIFCDFSLRTRQQSCWYTQTC